MNISLKNAKCLLTALEYAKTLKAEYVLIPRTVSQNSPYTSILGISYDAIVITSHFDAISKNPQNFVDLWEEPTISHIALATKNINQFMLMHKGMVTPALDASGKEIIPEVCGLEMSYTTYLIGNIPHSIAYEIREPIGERNENPIIPLVVPQLLLVKIESMLYGLQNSVFVCNHTRVDQDEVFRKIIQSKARDGSAMWIPEIDSSKEKGIEYAMTLSGNMFNIAKDDEVYCTIKDNLAGKTGYNFIAQFDVKKVKKKCSICYNLMMLKVV